jgi:uncharacterized membrane protein
VPIFLAVVHGTIGTLLWAVNGFPLLPLDQTILVMLTGGLYVLGTFMLFKALVVEETSRIAIWTQMAPVVTLMLSIVVLDEHLTAWRLIGFLVVFAATLGLAFQPGSLKPTPAFWAIMAAVVVWAGSDILFKYTVTQYPQLLGTTGDWVDIRAFLLLVNYQSWGFALNGLIIYLFVAPIRHAVNHRLRVAPRYGLAVLFGNEVVFIVRQFIRSMALALGPVALVSVIDGLRIFLGIMVGWGLTLLAPRLFREDITRQGLIRKLSFSVVLFAGIALIALTESG